jgi:(p)ppGpp synthase/HD superfamily hydrolase
MINLEALKQLILAPYIVKATALIGVERLVGGNQFRHAFSTLGILLDYKYFEESVLLKASLLHDLLEDVGVDDLNEIRNIDSDGPAVVDLVLEVTRNEESETKIEYLERLKNASRNAKILKCADRIQNLTDLHWDTHADQKISDYLDQTTTYILPLAQEISEDFVKEIKDLIIKRKKWCLNIEE